MSFNLNTLRKLRKTLDQNEFVEIMLYTRTLWYVKTSNSPVDSNISFEELITVLHPRVIGSYDPLNRIQNRRNINLVNCYRKLLPLGYLKAFF